MKNTDWTYYYFQYKLRVYIGGEVYLSERQVNRIFKNLCERGIIEVTPCKQKFRVVNVFD